VIPTQIMSDQIFVEQDGELEIPTELVGDVAPGTAFHVEEIAFPSTLGPLKGFLLREVQQPI
jgi:hypothetical protein